MDGYKHYIRTDAAGNIVLGFTSAFEEPQDTDICILDDGPRHFHQAWPDLRNERGQLVFRWQDGFVERSQSELDAEWAARPPEPPSEVDKLKESDRVIDERTVGMQAIDDFTLQQQGTINERSQGMQEVDDFTLQLVTDLQQQIDQLKADVAALKGGV